jgi:cellulose synthase (UDP-forming)
MEYFTAEPSPRVSRSRSAALLGGVGLIVLTLVALEVSIRIVATFGPGYRLFDRIWAIAMLAADLFLALISTGFAVAVLRSAQQNTENHTFFARHTTAPVAVLIAAFNESEEVLELTIASTVAMDYPEKHVYLLDDSTKPASIEAARMLAERYGITLVHRVDRSGYKAGAINDLLPTLTEKYIALLDADSIPHESWLREVVPYLEDDPGLALVQAPQVYGNSSLPVARTASFQQSVFYEYICEGKSIANATFCCGTNVVLRRAALLSVETFENGRRMFFDETSLTEDFATSWRLHIGGWRTGYINLQFVLGMGPETLSAYFTQQMRWAEGTFGLLGEVVRTFVRNPRALKASQWWEYVLSSTYYWIGLVDLVFLLTPILFTLFKVQPLRVDASLYLFVVLPYTLATICFFLLTMRMRGKPVREVWLASVLSYGTFWTYVKAALVTVMGLKRAFAVTPKGVGGVLPLKALRVELALLVANVVAALEAFWHLGYYGPDLSYAANAFWATYNAAILGTLFLYFNRPVSIEERHLLFETATATSAPARA